MNTRNVSCCYLDHSQFHEKGFGDSQLRFSAGSGPPGGLRLPPSGPVSWAPGLVGPRAAFIPRTDLALPMLRTDKLGSIPDPRTQPVGETHTDKKLLWWVRALSQGGEGGTKGKREAGNIVMSFAWEAMTWQESTNT